MRAYLKEIKRLLRTAGQYFHDLNLGSLNSRVFRLEQAATLDRAAVVELRAELTPPQWFTDYVQFCVEWGNFGSSSPCSGDRPRMCASPGALTPPVINNRDPSSYVQSGCKIQWAIKTAVTPDDEPWFDQVKICNNFRNGGLPSCMHDGYDQSTYVAEETECAPINEFTPMFFADNYIAFYCVQKWRIEVPEEAPLWMQTMRFCFSFEIPNNQADKYCAMAPGFFNTKLSTKTVCATANAWTPLYCNGGFSSKGPTFSRWGLRPFF